MMIEMPYECPPQHARQSKPFDCGNLHVCHKRCPHYPPELLAKKEISSNAICMVCGDHFKVAYTFGWSQAPRTCGDIECKRAWRNMSKDDQAAAIKETVAKMKAEKAAQKEQA